MIVKTLIVTQTAIVVEDREGRGKPRIYGPGIEMWIEGDAYSKRADWSVVMNAAMNAAQNEGIRPSMLRYYRSKASAPGSKAFRAMQEAADRLL